MRILKTLALSTIQGFAEASNINALVCWLGYNIHPSIHPSIHPLSACADPVQISRGLDYKSWVTLGKIQGRAWSGQGYGHKSHALKIIDLHPLWGWKGF